MNWCLIIPLTVTIPLQLSCPVAGSQNILERSSVTLSQHCRSSLCLSCGLFKLQLRFRPTDYYKQPLFHLVCLLPFVHSFFFFFLFFFQDIVVRVCFILGNMTADDEEVRSLLYFKNSVPDCLTPLLRHFLQLQLEQVSIVLRTKKNCCYGSCSCSICYSLIIVSVLWPNVYLV